MADIEQQTPPADGADEHAEEKVVFSPEQQAKITEIVKAASARAGSEARQEAERLRKELEQVKAKFPLESADTALALAEAKLELQTLKTERTESALKDTLRAAVGNQFVDSELATQILRSQLKIGSDGKAVAVDANGNARLNASFEPMTVAELCTELAQQKPFLARGQTRGGSGSTPALNNTSNAPKLESLFGRTSSGAEANKLAMRDINTYRRLRALAHEKGIC